MLLENIPLGKTLEIYIEREGYRYHLVSKVEKVDARRICVTAITAGNRIFKVNPEDDIRLVYRDEDQMWEWLHVRGGIGKLEGSAVHYFDIVDKGRSFNRRQAYRVDINADVIYSYYKIPGMSHTSAYLPEIEEEYEVYLDEKGKPLENATPDMQDVVPKKMTRMVPMSDVTEIKSVGMIRDISENGLGIFSNEEMEIGDNFAVNIPSDYGDLLTRCNIIRMDDKVKNARKFRYYYGCVYSESDQRLIKYIFDIQRKQIQKKRETKRMEEEMRQRRRDTKR